MSAKQELARPITIAICALGGQGGGVLGNWIIQSAEHAGFIAQATSVPGVAQRTGATIYYLELFNKQLMDQSGQTPVLALMPVPGDVDIVLAAELMEAGRAIARGFVTKQRTHLISSSHRVLAISEKSAIGDGQKSAKTILEKAKETAKSFIAFDMDAMAKEKKSFISSVLLGALAGSGATPIAKEHFEQTIKDSKKAVETNLKAFAAGFEAAQKQENITALEPDISASLSPLSSIDRTALSKDQITLVERLENNIPVKACDLALAGVRKLVDYQNFDYARLYLDRLEKISQLDDKKHKFRLTNETARYLALWMSYEDVIRVAELKIRAERFQRVKQESKVGTQQMLHISEYMHPRIEEICDMLPARLGQFILKKTSLKGALNNLIDKPRTVKTSKLSGFLPLYLIARRKPKRLKTYRYKQENKRIEQWLELISFWVKKDYKLACELVACQRIVKGYGATLERGIAQFKAITNYLAVAGDQKNLAKNIAQLKDAALADEDGEAFDALLKRLQKK